MEGHLLSQLKQIAKVGVIKMNLIAENEKIYDIVKKYPEIKNILIKISPKFKKLNNPVMFNTVARKTTVKKAAQIAGIDIEEMLDKLNRALEKE
jgi:hypothetical protein